MFQGRSHWGASLFTALTVMGWIFNAYGMALIVMRYEPQRASGFFLAGIGFWVIAASVLALYARKPLPGRSGNR